MIDYFKMLWYNLKTQTFNKGGDTISDVRRKNKMWLDNHSRKQLLHRTKRNKKRRQRRNPARSPINRRTFVAPSVFSIVKNPEETISFYNRIINCRDEHMLNTQFYIDSSEVAFVTADAIMFLIAIINDTKSNKLWRYSFGGNFPKDQVAKEFYLNCGFTSYVTINGINKVKPLSDSIRIISGGNNDPTIVKEICEFVHEHCNMTRFDTVPLYNALVELMGNTVQHAYDKKRKNLISDFKWYLYADESGDSVNFVFLDTGMGIPRTVRKKITDGLKRKNRDSYFIQSALDGEYRSQTNDDHRSRGLPQISDCIKSGLFNNAFVFSGKGCCQLNESNLSIYHTNDFKNQIFGTLFCWSIRKRSF